MREEYSRIALAMNKFRIGETFTIQDLATEANVHWNTAKKALVFFKVIQELDPPKVKMTKKGKFILFRNSSRMENKDE